MVIRFEIDSDKSFQTAVQKALQEVNDLTVPFTLITKSWFQSNKFIFDVKSGPGKYADLNEAYKARKREQVGFIYPVLKAKGNLAQSLTQPGGSAINEIINKRTLVLGTRSKVAQYHQFGTSKMPARPPVLIGAEQTAPRELNKRKELWIQTIENYVIQKTAQIGRAE